MYKLDHVGSKVIYDDPGISSFSASEIAAIDYDSTSLLVYPYAHSATVNNEYDTWQFVVNDTEALLANRKLAFGLFLNSNANEDGNLIFSCVGNISLSHTAASHKTIVTPIFGRTFASTVTSSKAANSNLLDRYITLPFQGGGQGTYTSHFGVSCEVVDVVKSDGEHYFFGFQITNTDTATNNSINFEAGLTFYKDIAGINAARPDGLG